MYRHSIQAQQLLMNDASTNKAYCSLKRTMYTALLYILCIYLDVVASNYVSVTIFFASHLFHMLCTYFIMCRPYTLSLINIFSGHKSMEYTIVT